VHTMCAATGTETAPSGWCITGCTLSAGGALQWCRDALFPGTGFEQLMAEAAAVGPGSGGLVFLPYLTGERCPYPDPLARGAWIGLTARHTRGHLVRAVVEGVTFTMGQILDIVRGMGVPVGTVRLGGGGAKSELWRQTQADVYGARVGVTSTDEGPALGAALLAGVGSGRWRNVEQACAATIRESEVRDPRTVEAYERAREVHAGLYADLKPSFAALGAVDS
jgi:xylulokinase